MFIDPLVLKGFFTPGLRVLASGIVSMLMISVSVVGIIALSRKIAAREIIATYVSQRLCASCGYGLHDAVIEPDACTICPECGAAWRLGERPTSEG